MKLPLVASLDRVPPMGFEGRGTSSVPILSHQKSESKHRCPIIVDVQFMGGLLSC